MSAAATASLKLGSAERERLRAGALEYRTTLDDVALERCAAYAALLDRWRHAMNLISCRTAVELVDRHLLDALACAWPCGAAESIVDLGSGAGLPGVPLAIIAPERRTVLVEPRRRRASFLRAVKRDLRLHRVEVMEMRAEGADAGGVSPVDIALCRAVWSSDDEMLRVAAPWIRRGGLLLCLRSAARPIPTSRSDLAREQVLHYLVAGSDRRIDVYRKRSPECFT